MAQPAPPATRSRRAILRTAGAAVAAGALASGSVAAATPARRSVGVVGAGVVGLQTVRVLAEAGYDVTVYARDITPGTTSDVAWAVLFPHLVPPTPETLEAIQLSNAYYAALVDTGAAVYPRTLTFAADVPDVEQDLAPFGSLYPSYAAIPPGEVPGGYRYGWRVFTWWVDTRAFMPYLMRLLLDLDVSVTVRDFSTTADILALPHQVIVNCAGLGGGTIAGDPAVFPIKGQLVTILPVPLDDPIIHDRFHIFPRGDSAVLGGTHEEHSFDVSTPEDVTRELIAGNQRIMPSIRRDQVLSVRAGLRPFREGGPRIEAETIEGKLLVHNYGHGGSGWTMAPGSAEQVAHLLAAHA
jgi:D-amino-acid oxidase